MKPYSVTLQQEGISFVLGMAWALARLVPGRDNPVEVKRRPVALAAIKAVHTLAWFSIESCLMYLLYAASQSSPTDERPRGSGGSRRESDFRGESVSVPTHKAGRQVWRRER